MNDPVQQQIGALIERHEVILFMKGTRAFPRCGFSATAVNILGELGVDFETVDVLADPDLRQGIKIYSDWPTIPQLYIRGEFIGGSDILRQLHATGELRQKLDGGEAVARPLVKQLEVTELKALMDADPSLRLLDVREQDEREIVTLPNSDLYTPALRAEVLARPKDTPLYLVCRTGHRSDLAAAELVSEGFTQVHNVVGGIHAWSRHIDPSVPQY